MQLASKIKLQSVTSLASIAFYGVTGIVFIILLPISGFPPHVGLLGIASIAAAYGLLMNQKWARWLVVALFFVASTFTLYTLYFTIGSDAITAVSMITYSALTWVFTAIAVKKPKSSEI